MTNRSSAVSDQKEEGTRFSGNADCSDSAPGLSANGTGEAQKPSRVVGGLANTPRPRK